MPQLAFSDLSLSLSLSLDDLLTSVQKKPAAPFQEIEWSKDGSDLFLVESFGATLYIGDSYKDAHAVYLKSQSNEKVFIHVTQPGVQHVIRQHRYQADFPSTNS